VATPGAAVTPSVLPLLATMLGALAEASTTTRPRTATLAVEVGTVLASAVVRPAIRSATVLRVAAAAETEPALAVDRLDTRSATAPRVALGVVKPASTVAKSGMLISSCVKNTANTQIDIARWIAPSLASPMVEVVEAPIVRASTVVYLGKLPGDFDCLITATMCSVITRPTALSL